MVDEALETSSEREPNPGENGDEDEKVTHSWVLVAA